MFKSVKKVVDKYSYFALEFDNNIEIRITILNDHVFRFQIDPNGHFPYDPEPHDTEHIAKILSKQITKYVNEDSSLYEVSESINEVVLETSKISIVFNKSSGLLKVLKRNENIVVLEELKPITFINGESTQTLRRRCDEFFYGGGTQNGRFCHNGETIHIFNTNQWDDGGVASPNPFYWSSKGYGVLRHTWSSGVYNFNDLDDNCIEITHKTNDFDAFYFINDQPVAIFQDYYELTGRPLLIPEYAFYESHFNAYNRDYWVEVDEENGIKFEDGKYYKEFLPDELKDQIGILESLNGENNNYQFSARAVINRYKENDMPLGWFIPNDGYGAGYGQTNSLDGDINNLKEFVDFCELNGVKVGLWTESNLHPVNTSNPIKGDRDLLNEIRIAGIVALKTDVAWVGPGYSFGLNGIEDAAKTFLKGTGGKIRPMIITVDGWAGTQRHSAIWTGDQTGGNWENIRFHIPTVIGTSLSGQPNVGADVDGIFGGQNKAVNIRDFQWKAFIPIQMNMDGWGSNPKTPFVFDQEATDINRAYLKLKSTLLPYNYSIAFEATNGLPMIRSMALEFPLEKPAYTKDSQYQYMWGASLLIAPIYNDKCDENGNSMRDGLYLPNPQQMWIDFFTGEKYRGGHIINNLKVPLWKIPVFVKDGAIIPITSPNNNPGEINRNERIILMYPNGVSEFNLYEDDGISSDYLKGICAITTISCKGPTSNKLGNLEIAISKTKGSYKGFSASKTVKLIIMISKKPDSVKLIVGGQEICLTPANSRSDFDISANAYFFDQSFVISKYLSESSRKKLTQTFLLIKISNVDSSLYDINVLIENYENKGVVQFTSSFVDSSLQIPQNVDLPECNKTPYSLKLTWHNVKNAKYYEVERDNTIFTNITEEEITFDNFSPSSTHSFRIRAVNEKGVSEWSSLIKGTTKIHRYKNLIHGIKAVCNYPEQNGQELENLLSSDNNIWHTDWIVGTANPQQNKYIILNFDLGSIHFIDKVEYIPRNDAGNGTILELKYRTSSEKLIWSEYSETIKWDCNNSLKSIALSNHFQYFELTIIKSIGHFGSGEKMLFFKKENQ